MQRSFRFVVLQNPWFVREEFPPINKFKDDKKVTLAQDKLKAMMKKTSFAISTDEARYVLNGIFISLKEHKMTIVATDGRRLALTDEEVDISEKSQGEFIIPAKAVNELNRLLQDKGEVVIKYAENQAEFELKDDKGFSVVIVSKLIEGNYPTTELSAGDSRRSQGTHQPAARRISPRSEARRRS